MREWLLSRLIPFIHTGVYPTRAKGIDVMGADWDTLIILDACRADLFEERVPTSSFDSYDRVVSRGSTTSEWIRQTFGDGSFGDTVYVSANPFVSRYAGDRFHRLYEPWWHEFDTASQTVLPGDTTAVALEALDAHPDKRLIVHYMQPHHPFVETPELQYRGWDISDFDDWTEHHPGSATAEVDRGPGGPRTPWDAMDRGTAGYDAVWSAYGRNLELVMADVDRLLAAVDGRTVVTSDHGNLLGERTWPVPIRMYGHRPGVRHRGLVEVPWAVLEGESRRHIVAGRTTAREALGSSPIESRLEALGYV